MTEYVIEDLGQFDFCVSCAGLRGYKLHDSCFRCGCKFDRLEPTGEWTVTGIDRERGVITLSGEE